MHCMLKNIQCNIRTVQLLVPPYAGLNGEKVITSLRKSLETNLSDSTITKPRFSANRLRDRFKI